MNEFQRRIGVGEPCRSFGRLAGTTRNRPIGADDGPMRGRKVGHNTDHWDGRVDATVQAPAIRTSLPLPAPKGHTP